jgi:hypothetical protein
MQWVLGFPELRMVGKYKISGKVFSLSIEGSGTFWMIMGKDYFFFMIYYLKNIIDWMDILTGNVTAQAHQKLALREISKKENRLYVIEQQLDMTYDKLRMRLNKYFS